MWSRRCLGTLLSSDEEIQQRVVLCPINEDARLGNEEILERLHAQKLTYKSVDVAGAVEGEDEACCNSCILPNFSTPST